MQGLTIKVIVLYALVHRFWLDHEYCMLHLSSALPNPFLIHALSLVTRVTRRFPQVGQELLSIPEHLNSPPIFSGVCVARSLVFCVVFRRSLLVLLTFFIWPLCCLFFDLRILITPLIISNSPCNCRPWNR